MDGVTVEGALTISQADIRLTKNGGAFAQTNNAAGATHMENGYYSVPLDATDTNTLGRLKVAVNESGALPVWADFTVLPANVYDSVVAGSDKLDVNVEEWNATAVPAEHTAGYPVVTIKSGTGSGEISLSAGLVSLSSSQSYNNNGSVGSVSGAVGSVANLTNRTNTAQAGAAGSITLDASASAVTDFYKGLWVNLTAGAGAGQTRLVTAYDGTTKVATVHRNWATNPDNTSVFALIASASVDGVNGAIVGDITGNLSGSVGSLTTNNDKTGYRLSATGVDDVWDEVLSGHLTAGTTGAALNAAGSAGDPWSTALPGAYGAGTAGKIIGDNLNATISSRMATFTLPTNFSALVISAGGTVNADAVAISTDTVAADRLETMLDGTGGNTLSLGALAVSGNTTFTGTTTHTGNVAYSDGITVSAPSTANRAGISVTGNGSGSGIASTGGSTGAGFTLSAGASGSAGFRITGGSVAGIYITCATSATQGIRSIGGTSGSGASFEGGTGGHGLSLLGATVGHGLLSTGGATGHGAKFAGGGTSGDGAQFVATVGDGIEAVGAGGGYDINADIQGTLSGAVSVGGTTWYVDGTNGNDTTGTGSRTAPYQTISKATSVATGGDSIEVEDGTYAESTGGAGFFNLNQNFEGVVTIRSRRRNASGVTITGASDATYNTLTNAACAGYRFEDITFAARVSTNVAALRITQGTALQFIRCPIVAPTDTGGVKYAVHMSQSGATSIVAPYFEDCTITAAGATGRAVEVSTLANGSATTTDPQFIRCEVTGAVLAFDVTGNVTGLVIDGGVDKGVIVSTGTYGIKVGPDSNTGSGTITGELRNSIVNVSGGTGHAVLLGGGTDGFKVRDNIIYAGDYGIVLKADNQEIYRNHVYGGTAHATNGAAIYLKGTAGAKVRWNTFEGYRGTAGVVRIGVGDTSGDKNGTYTITDNTIVAHGIPALLLGGSSDDSGGGTFDRNLYDLRGGATFGTVYGTAGVSTWSGLLAAWNSYDVTTNDEKSARTPPTDADYRPIVDQWHKKFSIAGTTLTAKRDDGTTADYTRTLTTDPSAQAITASS